MATEVVIPGILNILWVRDFIQAEDFKGTKFHSKNYRQKIVIHWFSNV